MSLPRKRARLQKRASIALAGGAHVAQNALVNRLLKNRRYAQTLGQEFREGFSGIRKGRLQSALSGLVGGAVAPELNVLSGKARELGETLASKLREQGITQLNKKQLLAARMISEGRFSDLTKLNRLTRDPAIKPMLDTALQHIQSPLQSHQILEAVPGSPLLTQLESRWKSGDSPLTSNVISNLTRAPRAQRFAQGFRNIAVGTGQTTRRPGWELAGNAVGSAAVSAVDPFTGAMNAGKSVLTNPASRGAIQSQPSLASLLGKADQLLFHNPVQQGFQSGMQGQQPSSLRRGAQIYGLNALTGQMANTANMAGQVNAQVQPIKQKLVGQ